MAEKKITKREKYEMLLALVEGNEMLTDFINHEIELAILCECIERGCEWNTDYKVYRSICKTELRQFEVVDAEGKSYIFDYTSKRHFNNENGLRFTIKQRD